MVEGLTQIQRQAVPLCEINRVVHNTQELSRKHFAIFFSLSKIIKNHILNAVIAACAHIIGCPSGL